MNNFWQMSITLNCLFISIFSNRGWWLVKIGISIWASGFRWPMDQWWLLFLKFFDSVQVDPLPGPKNDFYWIWTMGYGFRHVLMVQQAQALELKPHLWYNEDLWKKLGTLSIGNLPTATTLSQFWPEKAVFSTGT